MEALYGRRVSLLQPCACRRQARDSGFGGRGGWGLGVHMQVHVHVQHVHVHAHAHVHVCTCACACTCTCMHMCMRMHMHMHMQVHAGQALLAAGVHTLSHKRESPLISPPPLTNLMSAPGIALSAL